MATISGDYQFAAQPRALKDRQLKYREPYYEVMPPPANIMFDRRVVRGNTYAAMIIPASTQQEIERQQEQERKYRRLQQDEKRQEQSQDQEITPHESIYNEDEQIIEDQYEELRQSELKNETQSQFFIDRPPSPEYIPVEDGKAIETQIEDGELFDFDVEVDCILEVIVGKTLEEARMEVLEEHDLKLIEKHKADYEQQRVAELLEVQRLEAEEIRRRKESQRRQLQARTRRDQMALAHQKYCCRMLSKRFLKDLKAKSIDFLKEIGVFQDPSHVALYNDFEPWLMERIMDFNDEAITFRQNFKVIFEQEVERLKKKHNDAIKKEQERRVQHKVHLLKIEEETQIRKEKRREQRVIRQAERDRQALYERIETEIVQRGELREQMIHQLYSDIDGRVQESVIGTPGGLFGEILLLISSIEQSLQSVLTQEQIYALIADFVTNWMKCPQLVFANLSEEPFQDFLASLNEEEPILLENLHAAPDEIQEQVLDYIKNTDNAFQRTSLTEIWHNLYDFGIREGLIEALIYSFFQILTAKDTEELTPNPIRQKVLLKLLNFDPEGHEQAVVRIRIPLKPVVSPEPESIAQDHSEDQPLDHPHEQYHQELNEEHYEPQEIEVIEDRVHLICPNRDDLSVFIIHQAAQRFLRNDLLEFCRNTQALEQQISVDEIKQIFNEKAEVVESKLIQRLGQDLPMFDFELN